MMCQLFLQIRNVDKRFSSIQNMLEVLS